MNHNGMPIYANLGLFRPIVMHTYVCVCMCVRVVRWLHIGIMFYIPKCVHCRQKKTRFDKKHS